MNPTFPNQLPEDNLNARNAIFSGEVYLASKNATTSALVNDVKQLVKEELNVQDIRRAHLELSDDQFFTKMGKLRRTIYQDDHYQQHIRNILASHQFDPDRCAFDPVRIRVILPGGHNNANAAPVYYAHRDTWYAHPQSLIVGWIPLDDLSAEETFEFYPDFFDVEVPNDSEIFDYSDWIKDGPALKIGWQKQDSGLTADYPQAAPDHNPGKRIGFRCKEGEMLLFAGSQYHQTLPQDFGTIRYSLDFRVVHLDDAITENGSPNADNRSKGNILKDYIHPHQ